MLRPLEETSVMKINFNVYGILSRITVPARELHGYLLIGSTVFSVKEESRSTIKKDRSAKVKKEQRQHTLGQKDSSEVKISMEVSPYLSLLHCYTYI
jgi:hypothetical protein